MRTLMVGVVFLVGCLRSNALFSVGDSGAPSTDLAIDSLGMDTADLSRGDAAPADLGMPMDLAGMADLAHAADLSPVTTDLSPADLAPACGGFNQPCCNTGAYPYPSYCTTGLVCLYGNPVNHDQALCAAAGDGFNRCGRLSGLCGGYRESCCTINGDPAPGYGIGFCRINGGPSQCGNSCVPCTPNG